MMKWLQDNVAGARAKMAAEVSKFKNRTFMEAVVSGCAVVAAADGEISADEKQKMVGFIQRADELKHFEMREVIEVFKKSTEDFEFDQDLGRASAFQRIARVKGNDEQARLLVRVVCAIANADGEFNENERQSVREICAELGLNAEDFDL